MNVADGVLIGLALALGLRLIWASARTGRRRLAWPLGRGGPDPGEAHGMQSALHAATATLPHLRRGLDVVSATEALPHLRALTGAAAIALADTETVLAIDGEGREQVRPGDMLTRLLARTHGDGVRVVPRLVSSDPNCPLHAAALAPLVVGGRRVGTLIAFYRATGRPSEDELRVVAEARSLVCAQVELSVLAEQERRLARAELRALRAQISPHFLYNALAAVAANIHEDPEAAREQLIDFAEFTRYLFRDGRSYVSLAEEVEHVTRYLRLEQARFPGVLDLRLEIEPATRNAIVPTMSLQPLAENAIRHGVRRPGGGTITIRAIAAADHVELSVADDGVGFVSGIPDLQRSAAGGGIGLANVDGRLRNTFGEQYRLRIDSSPGVGTTVTMIVPPPDAESLGIAA
jgi:two-component system, LytTR family, sensor kinase